MAAGPRLFKPAQSPAKMWAIGYIGLKGFHVRRVAFSRAEARAIKLAGQSIRAAYVIVADRP